MLWIVKTLLMSYEPSWTWSCTLLYDLELVVWLMIGLVHVRLVMTWTIELILVACELSSILYHVDLILELELIYGLVNVQVSHVMNG